MDLLHDDAGGLVEDFDKIYQELERLYGVEFMRQLTGGLNQWMAHRAESHC